MSDSLNLKRYGILAQFLYKLEGHGVVQRAFH